MADEDKEYQRELLDASIELVKLLDVRWIEPLHGVVPVTAQGLYKEQYFYFRARYNTVRFILAPDANWNYEESDIKHYEYLVTTDPFGAGVLSGKEYTMIIAIFLQTVMDSRD